ncbi:MAG TPA: outer membrane beta-barrel family protein [Arachidicoccus sp.]
MKRTLLLLILCAFSLLYVHAQSIVIRGKIDDTTSGENLTNATVCLLRSSDSILQNFTRAKTDGSFLLTTADTGKYVLLISYPQYADFVQQVSVLDKDQQINLGTITLVQITHLLQDVIVTQKLAAIRIKGDTTEFVADSFKTQPNATVEDLLKRLPGIQVDKDGKITAQGQSIPKVLVDGEEFFGDDPTLVTKNLRADMVDKVQLFDKQSDQAAFTGIDDGNKTKTINIKLKEDKKNGYFGKASSGVGSDKYYETQGMYNNFKSKRKVSVYSTFGNDGKIGLGFQDEMQYGSSAGISTDVNDDGSVMFMINNDNSDPLSSWNGNYNGSGIPNAKTGGIHYDNKWDDDKQDINLNYKIGGLNVYGRGKTTTQNNLPSGVLYSNATNRFNNDLFRQKLDGIYDLKLDSSSSLKITVGGSLSHTTTDNITTNSTSKVGDTLVNSGTGRTTDKANTKTFSGNILWQKKFKKAKRTLSLNANEFIQNKDNAGFINNRNDFYTGLNTYDSSDIVNQRKVGRNQSNSLDTKLTYSEPITKYLSLVLDYGIVLNNTTSDIRSYNRSNDSSYSLLDSLFSNHYIYNQFAHRGGVAFSYNKSKIRLNFGTDISDVKFRQTNTFTMQRLDRNFINWAPHADMNYKFNTHENVELQYQGSTQQPSADQIQPVINNNDNLNVYEGNPDLKPSFKNSLNVHFSSYKDEQSINIYGNYNFTSNPIVADVTTNDSRGANRYTYLNINSSTSDYYGSVNIDRKWKKMDMRYGFSLGINGNKYANSVNGVLNTTSANSYSFGINLDKYKEKKYEFYVWSNLSYNSSNSTLQNQIDNNSWSSNINPNLDIFFPAKFQLHTDGNYKWQGKTQTFDSYSQFIWNAWFGRKFLKRENLLLKFSVNDILNQNNGYSRQPYNNTFTQSVTSTIGRYFMLSLEWNFTKMGAGNKH